ncbi:MAG TPA: ATP-dependent DNA helicase [Candidatus Limnocylindrales bacterium]
MGREPPTLTPEQERIVRYGDGPVIVIAGAGTGKTRVIVERVRWLLDTMGAGSRDSAGRLISAEPGEPPTRPAARPRPSPARTPAGDAPAQVGLWAIEAVADGLEVPEAELVSAPPPAPLPALIDAFAGPLLPEQILVLTYNVKAARELQDRLDQAVGPAVRARMSVSNFHSFCHQVLSDAAAEAGLPPHPDVLDGIGQMLLLRDLEPGLDLLYHAGWWALGPFVQFINRAKDELVTPDEFDAYVADERAVFEARYGPFETAHRRLEQQGNLTLARNLRKEYAKLRRFERAEARGDELTDDHRPDPDKAADREARRTVLGTGAVQHARHFAPSERVEVDRLAASYVIDGAALEIVRLEELARVYRAYQAELIRRGALDFGEQIAAVTRLWKVRPNILRRWQRQFRYVLVDEFQDANVAQIELIEMIGRTPDRPDNVMVVGDDDQSIYHFRGASFAAFSEFSRRFSGPPTHDPRRPAPGPPARLRIEQNFRSIPEVLAVANRLIARNVERQEPDKQLTTTRPSGVPVDIYLCASPEDEAVAIVDAIRGLVAGGDGPRAWSSVAILYRKHKHRNEIVARLREEEIPYTVVGGLSLFDTPEVRDLEQSLRAIADPHNDVALARMMSAGPWRLDPLEILEISRMARFDRGHLIDAARAIVASGQVKVERLDEPAGDEAGASLGVPTRSIDVGAGTRAKLRRLLETMDELAPETWREGPFTLLERFIERTGQILDLIGADTRESQRIAVNLASFLRFANDWQTAFPTGHLNHFVDYLDAYQEAGGELPTSVELTEDVDGVRLMTVYQAKGLEFRNVIVPGLVEREWPSTFGSGDLFPVDLLREGRPSADFNLDEERRLLYVALTRAQDRLIVTGHSGPNGQNLGPSPFLAELRDAEAEGLAEVSGIRFVDRTIAAPAQMGAGATPAIPGLERTAAAVRAVMPLPTKRERRLALRLRATELLGMLEGTDAANPEAEDARRGFTEQLAAIGRSAAVGAEEARALGLDPFTFQALAQDSAAGANLLEVAPLAGHFSYSQFATYERCPLQYAFASVYRIPTARTAGYFAFGHAAHAAFEQFTKERRARLARGEAAPTKADLEAIFAAEWRSAEFGDRTTEAEYLRKTGNLLERFWDGELSTSSEAIHEELEFSLAIEPGDGSSPVIVSGSIDRIDRLPGGGIEVIDYKTGRITSQKDVGDNLQLSIYALACRDALGLGTPERVTLYFTESSIRMSTTRTDAELDAARLDILARAARIRSGDFAATPSKRTCGYCDYAALCPSRVT